MDAPHRPASRPIKTLTVFPRVASLEPAAAGLPHEEEKGRDVRQASEPLPPHGGLILGHERDGGLCCGELPGGLSPAHDLFEAGCRLAAAASKFM